MLSTEYGHQKLTNKKFSPSMISSLWKLAQGCSDQGTEERLSLSSVSCHLNEVLMAPAAFQTSGVPQSKEVSRLWVSSVIPITPPGLLEE
jgi:hypothetical protein